MLAPARRTVRAESVELARARGGGIDGAVRDVLPRRRRHRADHQPR
ncbi:hypothetical protein [Nocardioides sp. TF02-7]|nr:hypothetical protein [Nocardioides sp. TF02-7]UMG92567.1 hypothetical protein MF408_22635 [Nocardioides sp. TF02-7]